MCVVFRSPANLSDLPILPFEIRMHMFTKNMSQKCFSLIVVKYCFAAHCTQHYSVDQEQLNTSTLILVLLITIGWLCLDMGKASAYADALPILWC